MSYFEDLSLYNYWNEEEKSTYNVGWIEGEREFKKGNVSQEFIENLWCYVKYPINVARGFHYDEILQKGKEKIVADDGSYNIRLGYAEIRVFDHINNAVYASPNMILYYVIKHGYKPPECFINAVVKSPKPNSEEYSFSIKKSIFDNYNKFAEKEGCPFCGKGYHIYGFAHGKEEEGDYKPQILELMEQDVYVAYEKYIDLICISCGKKYYKVR